MKKEIILSIGLLILSIITYFLKYGMHVLLANHLPPHYYGDLAIALRTLIILATLTLLGTATAAKRFLAFYLRTHDKSNITHYLRWNLKLMSYTFTICILLALISGVALVSLHHLNIYDIRDYHIAIYMLWIAPIAAFSFLLASYLSCNKHVILAYICQYLARFILLISFFMAYIFIFNLPLNNFEIISIFFLTFIILIIIELVLIAYKMPYLFSLIFNVKQKINNKQKEWLKTSTRLIIINITFMFITLMDLIIVELFAPSENDVGYYSAVLVITSSIWVIPRGIYQFINPRISSLINSQKGRIQLQTYLNSANIVLFIMTIITTSLLILFSEWLLLHFGKAYLSANTSLLICICGTFIGVGAQSSTFLLIYSGYEKSLMNINYVEISSLLILGIPLTLMYSINGIAVAYTISISIKTIITIYLARTYSRMKPLSII